MLGGDCSTVIPGPSQLSAFGRTAVFLLVAGAPPDRHVPAGRDRERTHAPVGRQHPRHEVSRAALAPFHLVSEVKEVLVRITPKLDLPPTDKPVQPWHSS